MSTKNESEERTRDTMNTGQSHVEQQLQGRKNMSRLSSSNALVPIVGLSYFAVFALALILQSIVTTGSLANYQFFFIPFAILSIIAAIGIWRRPRLGYIVAIPLSAILVIIFFATRDGNDAITVLSNPANTREFVFYATNVPTFFAVFFSSIFGVREVRRFSAGNPRQMVSSRISSASKVIGLVLVGFILGGLVVGLTAGATEGKLLTTPTPQNSVTIVLGAGSTSNDQFYVPSTLTVKVGTTVTWINHDSAPHTVTSTNGSFDSGNMNSGGVYTFTFIQPGNYAYYCKYHSWMKGTIIVTSS